LRKPSPLFRRLLEQINAMPVVDCHEHLRGPERDLAATSNDPIQYLSTLYLISDLWAVGAREQVIAVLEDPEATSDEKWPIFIHLWEATEHTAYARVTKMALREIYGIDKLTRESLDGIAEKLKTRSASDYMQPFSDAGIMAVIADVLVPPVWERQSRYFGNPELRAFLEDQFRLPEIWRPAFSLPYFHEIRFHDFVDDVGAIANSHITSLEAYEEAVSDLIRRAKEKGAVAIKDQSAYRRVIDYELPPRSDAERLFNRLMMDPRSQLAWPEAKPLDDYLFHQFMRCARNLDMPVQVHTGHLAGIRNRVDKANAAHFASVLELHSEVKFDLFHGNWPYMGDLLFLGKNYPNVTIDLCWVSMIDPLYTQELLKRAILTVPHAKVFGFGGDYYLLPELAAAHLALAREVICSALTDLVECGWVGEEEALRMAADFLYNNPNRFYKLGLKSYEA
jgi:predicted TIM-barrel fold metal-dependent hydrolase